MVQTMALAPPPQETGRALELGCYMQMTPALAVEHGYREVCGGYYGQLGQTETKSASVQGQEIFRCQVDLFDAERGPVPLR